MIGSLEDKCRFSNFLEENMLGKLWGFGGFHEISAWICFLPLFFFRIFSLGSLKPWECRVPGVWFVATCFEALERGVMDGGSGVSIVSGSRLLGQLMKKKHPYNCTVEFESLYTNQPTKISLCPWIDLNWTRVFTPRYHKSGNGTRPRSKPWEGPTAVFKNDRNWNTRKKINHSWIDI